MGTFWFSNTAKLERLEAKDYLTGAKYRDQMPKCFYSTTLPKFYVLLITKFVVLDVTKRCGKM